MDLGRCLHHDVELVQVMRTAIDDYLVMRCDIARLQEDRFDL